MNLHSIERQFELIERHKKAEIDAFARNGNPISATAFMNELLERIAENFGVEPEELKKPIPKD